MEKQPYQILWEEFLAKSKELGYEVQLRSQIQFSPIPKVDVTVEGESVSVEPEPKQE